MTIRTKISKDMLERLHIPKDRYDRIMSYIDQMIIDYNGNPVDIIKEIKLNLKGNERYLGVYATGSFFHPLFKKMSEKEKSDFMDEIAKGLKLDNEKVSKIQTYLMENLPKYLDENLPNIQALQNIISSQFSDVEKDFIIFILGLVDFIEEFSVR